MIVNANFIRLSAGCLMCACLAPSASLAIETANPYASIAERNAFGLKPPPPAEPPGAKKSAAEEKAAKIYLTGITRLKGEKKAWFTLTEGKAPNAPAKSVSLKEHQKSGDLEVIEIRDKKGEVRVIHFGEEKTLSFKENKAQSVPINIPNSAPAAAPGAPPQPQPMAPGQPPGPTLAEPPAMGRGRFGRGRGGQPAQPADAGAVPGQSPTDVAAAIEQAVQTVAEQRAAANQSGFPLPPLPELPNSPAGAPAK